MENSLLIRDLKESDHLHIYQMLVNCYNEMCQNVNLKKPIINFEQFKNCIGYGTLHEKILDCLVLEKKNQLIGVLTYSFTFSSYNGKEIYLSHIYVIPEYRSLGFGSLLLKKLSKIALENNITTIKYETPRNYNKFVKFMKNIANSRSLTEENGYLLYKFHLC